MKVTVTVKHTQTATFDIGDMPVNMVRDVLIKNEGTFDGNWSLGDIRGGDTWVVDSVEVVEATKAAKT
jgi:hypothetical protein